MSDDNRLYLHCKTCIIAGRKDKISVSMDDKALYVVCDNCGGVVCKLSPDKLQLLLDSFHTQKCAGCEMCLCEHEDVIEIHKVDDHEEGKCVKCGRVVVADNDTAPWRVRGVA